MLLPWLELFTLIQLGIQTSALTAIALRAGPHRLILGIMPFCSGRAEGMFERLRQGQEGRRIVGPRAVLMDDMAMGLAGLLLVIPRDDQRMLAALIVVIGPLQAQGRLLRALTGPRPAGVCCPSRP